MLTDQVGALLKNARKALGFTQKDVARKADVSERLWAEVERGERPNVSLETALRMLSVVGLSIRLTDPVGSSHELRDPRAAAAARTARAAIRRATWQGRQIRLEQEGSDSVPAKKRVNGIGAVTRVSEQAFVVARAARGAKR